MKMVVMTSFRKEEILINMDLVQAIYPKDGGCLIYMGGEDETYYVEESLDSIKRWIL